MTQTNANQLAIAFNGTANVVVANFAGQGVWEFLPSLNNWVHLTQSDSSFLSINSSGTVAAAFGAAGVWEYVPSLSNWVQLTQTNASMIGIADNGNVVGGLPGHGVWEFFTSMNQWIQLSTAEVAPVGISISHHGQVVAGQFGDQGVWAFVQNQWVNLTLANATILAGA